MMIFLKSPAKKYSRYLQKHPEVVAVGLVRLRVTQLLQESNALENVLSFTLSQPTPELQEAARQGLVQVKPDLIESLVQLTASNDKAVVMLVNSVLEQLTLTESRQALCQIALTAAPLAVAARNIAVKANYYPQELHERALFFFLTKQLERYQGLDFDGRLLRLMYELADAGLRRQILEVARETGRSDLLLNVVSTLDTKTDSVELSQVVWQAFCRALIENKQYDAMWKVAQIAPPAQSAELILELFHLNKKNQWQLPDSRYEALLKQLARSASRCKENGPLPFGKGLVERTQLTDSGLKFSKFSISWDGEFLIAATLKGDIRLWNLPEGKLLLKTHLIKFPLSLFPDDLKIRPHFYRNHATIRAFQFTTEGEIICIYDWWISENGEKRGRGTWHKCYVKFALSEKNSLKVISQNAVPRHLSLNLNKYAISPNGVFLAVTNGDNYGLWSLPTFELIETHTKKDYDYLAEEVEYSYISKPVFHPNSTDVVVLANGSIWVRLQSRRSPVKLKGLELATFNWTGNLLATNNWEIRDNEYSQTINVYRFPGYQVKSITLHKTLIIEAHKNDISAIAVSPDGESVVSGHRNGTADIWNLAYQEPIGTVIISNQNNSIISMAFTPDGQSLVTLSAGGQLKLWTTKLIELSRQSLSKAKLADFVLLQEMRRNTDLLPKESAWLNFLLTQLKWKFQHEIEIG